MTRSELVKRLADENPGLPPETLRRVVDVMLSEVTEALADGRRVELRNFGAFFAKQRAPRTSMNPRTGAAVQTTGTASVIFRTGKGLSERLNPVQERS